MNPSHRSLHIYCSGSDRYPLRFVDLTELMLRQLPRHRIYQTWFVQTVGDTAALRIDDDAPGVRVVAPPRVARWGLLGKLVSKMAYWSIDTLMLLVQLRRPVDAIMIRDKYWAALVGWLVARLKRVPYLIWMSYPFPDDDLERAPSFRGPMRHMLWISGHFGQWAFYRVAMRRADHCFVQSERMKQDLHERFGIGLDRMTPVPMGVGPEFTEARAITPVPPDPAHPVVLYLGGLQVVRRLELMIDAFALVAAGRPEVRFKIVGSGSVPDDEHRLRERARSHGILDRVEFTGQLPFAQALRHVASADVCVSPIAVTPTLRVASPTKFVEYLALGRPTVGNDHPEQALIVERSQGALSVPWDANAFADAIGWCLDHPREATEMARRGQDWVLRSRTYDRIGQDVAEAFFRVVPQRAATPT